MYYYYYTPWVKHDFTCVAPGVPMGMYQTQRRQNMAEGIRTDRTCPIIPVPGPTVPRTILLDDIDRFALLERRSSTSIWTHRRPMYDAMARVHLLR